MSGGGVFVGGSTSPSRELDDLIMARVRPRFAVSTQTFLERVRQLAAATCEGTRAPLRDHVLSLSLDDLYLATACVGGEEKAWNELSTAHFGFMREFAHRFVPPQSARDVADEVIAELWARQRLRQYGGRSTLRTWLGTVVAHAALNSRQAMSRFVSLESGSVPGAGSAPVGPERFEPADGQVALMLQELVSEAVRRLDTEDRLLLQLYYEQEMTLDELSVMLRVSGPAISRRLKRVREDLRAGIETQARRRTGESADLLRAGLDLGRIELDLGKLLGGQLSKRDTDAEKA